MVGGDICLGLSRSTDHWNLTTYGMNLYEHRRQIKTNIWIGNTCAHCIEEPRSVSFENQVFPGCISMSTNPNEDKNKYKRKAGANTVAGQSGPIWAP